jgi:Zn-dependent protease
MDESWIIQRLIFMIPLILSLSVHEWAHAYSAWRLGDDTASSQGRMTLNPISHIDPIGTLLLPLMGVPFGWAKPVPVSPSRFRRDINMRTGMMITAAAGPASNIAIAVVCVVAFALLYRFDPAAVIRRDNPIVYLLSAGMSLNVILAIFNMLPIYPLDGSRVVDGLISFRLRPAWERFVQYSPLVLLFVIIAPQFMGFSIIGWPYQQVMKLLLYLMDFIVNV